jgi:hypothetical protein
MTAQNESQNLFEQSEKQNNEDNLIWISISNYENYSISNTGLIKNTKINLMRMVDKNIYSLNNN